MRARKPVVIEPWDPRWAQAFAELREVYVGALGELAVGVEHVGSTAIPGLAAKPVLDIDIVIAHEGHLPAVTQALVALGYTARGTLGIPGRHAFGQEGDSTIPRMADGRRWMDHHLYVCAAGAGELRRHLAFRDWLLADPDARAEYAALKQRLAEEFRNDREGYTEAKSAFIAGVLGGIRAPDPRA